MSKKIGQHYYKDPYPWDGAEKLACSAEWTCCDLKLPSTYFICPMCEKERDLDAAYMLYDESEVL